MFIWHSNENAAVAAQALADEVAHALQLTLDKKGQAVLAVSGGRSPIAFFEKLSQKELDWVNIGVTLVDERIVPVEHSDSNTGLVCQYLLQNNAAKATWIPMIEAGKSETELQVDAVVAFALKHYKQPDVLILGMGGDGHTASLFPHAPQLEQGIDLKNDVPLLHTTPMTAPHERISMTLGAILKTENIFLSIQGEEKKAVFDKAVAITTTELPISLILNNEGVESHVFYAN